MKVELINEEEAKDFLKNWGIAASVCYDTKTDKPENIGKHCMKSGHCSGSRGTYFVFRIEDISRSVIDQVCRHEIGVFKNVQSFRYVNKDNFAYEIPKEIENNNELLNEYITHMNKTAMLYDKIQKHVEDKTNSKERANEQARYVLPMSTHSSFVIGFTYEALVHFMHKRLCSRTEDITRRLAVAMKKEVIKYVPELDGQLVPECQYLLWCPEKKGCGAYPSKEELKLKISER